MAKVKAANYSEAEIAVLTSGYTGQDNASEVKALASQLGKTTASVRAKLSNMGVYQKAESVKSSGEGRTTKADTANAIASVTGMNKVEAEALTKTTSAVLDKLLAKLTN